MNILKYFLDLYSKNRQLVLLSWVYGITAVICVFIAGIFALINQSFGIAILIVPLVAVCAMAANIVVWALIHLVFDAAVKKYEEQNQTKSSQKSDNKKITK